MNWDAIGAIAEIVGAIVVIATLVYLSIQIRAQTRATKAQTYQHRADSGMDLTMRIAESNELAKIQTLIYIQSATGYEIDPEAVRSLDQVQFARFRMLQMAQTVKVVNEIKQYELGLLDDEEHVESIYQGIEENLTRWRLFRINVEFLERKLDEYRAST